MVHASCQNAGETTDWKPVAHSAKTAKEHCGLLGSLIVPAENFHALASQGFLTSDELAEIEDVTLHDASAIHAAVFQRGLEHFK